MTNPIGLHKENAAELWRKIEAGSQDPEDYRQLADVLVSQSRYEEAVSLYQRALSLPLPNFQKARVSMELGWLFYEMGKQSEALSLAQTAIGLISQEQETSEVLACRGASQSLLAHCAWSTDEKSGAEAARLALEWLERVINDDPGFKDIAEVYYDAARLQNLLGNTKQAIVLCEKRLSHQSNLPERIACLIVLSEALRREEQFTEAETALEEVFRFMEARQEAWPGPYLELGLIQRFTNRLAEAKDTFQQALRVSGADPYLNHTPHIVGEIYWNLAAVCYELEEYQEAAMLFEKVLAYHPAGDRHHCDALLWLGHSYFVMGAYAEAREWYKKVLFSSQSLNQQQAEAQEGLAKSYYQSNDYERALLEFKQVLLRYPESDPYHSTVLLCLGDCYEGTATYSKAQDCFKKVLALPHASETDKASARKGLVENQAKLYYESKQYKEAAVAFGEVLVNHSGDDPHRPNVLLWLGNSYEGAGAFAKARECYEEILASPHASEADKASAKDGLKRLPPSTKKTYH